MHSELSAVTPSKPDVSVWLCRARDWSIATAEQDCLSWLDPDELRRWRGFAFPRDQHLFLLAHGLLRWGLSVANCNVRPREWRFRAGVYGQPAVVEPSAETARRFSVSHTRGCAGVAIGNGEPIGIDVEFVRTEGDGALAAASASYSPDERLWLERQRLAGQAVPILRLWTLKEAYAKARGLGLHLPFESFSFALASRRGVRRFRPPAPDRDENWRFLEFGFSKCRVAIACHVPAGKRPFHVRVGTVTPGRWNDGRSITLRDSEGRWTGVVAE